MPISELIVLNVPPDERWTRKVKKARGTQIHVRAIGQEHEDGGDMEVMLAVLSNPFWPAIRSC